jgi:amidase
MMRIVRTICLVYFGIFAMFATPLPAHAQTTTHHFEVVGTAIAETQQAIREGRTTCRAVVEDYLARVRAYDQKTIDGVRLNSIVTVNPDALVEADACDREFARTHRLPPLGGIAVLIKDNYDTQGLQTTGGSLAMKGFVPEHDSTMVARLRAAGAIILAKTNMAEWAFSPYVTESSIAGITRNPYDLSRVPAGSSGGTAAAVAANLGESGLGTDTGNSIRGPSSHNDLVGIRPTIGLTSRAGIIPLFANNDVGGPIARTVADAAALLTVVAGPDPADPVTALDQERPALDYTRFLDRHGLRGARIGVFRQYFDTKTTDPEVKAVTERALHALEQEGAVLVDPFTIPNYEAMEKNLWCGDFEADLNAYLAKHPNAPYHDLASIVASGLYLPYIAEEIRDAVAPPKADDRRAPCTDVYHDPAKVTFRNALLAAMAKQHLDAIVYPTWSNAPRKVGDMKSPAGDNSQVLSPQTGFPAITVPMGFTHGTLPAGLTFLGPAFSESTLIRYAYDFEQTTQQRKDPPLFPALP